MQLPFHQQANPKTFKNARFLKKVMTEAEKDLWYKLRGRAFKNFKFRRQHPVASYVVDFYCHSCKLVIEVDGRIHHVNDNQQYDEARTKELESLGLRVIRFANDEVQTDITRVLKKILENLTSPPAPLL
ncbi:MAG: endonuclease domain-containing protein [Cyclobacteriaceae bacterium]